MRLEVVDELLYQGTRIWRVSRVGEREVDGYVVERWMPFKAWRYYENACCVADLMSSRGVAVHSDLVENPSFHEWRGKIRDRDLSTKRTKRTKSKVVKLRSPARPRRRFSRTERDREVYLLLPKAKLGDPKAIQRITELYHDVVQEVIRQTVVFHPSTSSLVGHEDLMQDGLEGLLLAIKRFDLSNSWGFEQYCRMKIKYWILDQVENKAYTIWLPRTILRPRSALKRARRQLESQGNHDPSLEELAHQAGLSLARTKVALEAPLVQASLNQLVKLGEITRELGEIWEEQAARDPRNDPEETDSFVEVEIPRLQEIVKKLSERERLVLEPEGSR